MAYSHGIKVSEVPTSVLPPVEVSAGIPMIIGTAPVNMTDVSNVNKPVLCYTYAEAVASFGYVPPADDSASGLKKYDYTISEFIKSQFSLFGVSPVVIVNVLDPTKHKTAATTNTVQLSSTRGEATISETGILPDSVELAEYVKGTDYEVAFDDDGNLVISSLTNSDGEFLCDVSTPLTFSAEKLDPSAVSADDIVGGVDVDGNKSGLELVNDVFPKFRIVPGILIAPKYSSSPAVAAVMATKVANINEVFTAISIVDVPTDEVKLYSAVAEWKNNNNVVDERQICCFPMLELDGVVYHQSTQLAGLIGQVDGNNDDVPYVSPSNKAYQMTSQVLADGTEVILGQAEAAYLNGQGVVTALNFIGGWRCWGNRTACYPGNTDVKDAFIPIKRMFSWVGNSIIQTYWERVDNPMNRRLVDTFVDSINIWLNGLTARQYLLGGRIEFLAEENPETDLMDGKITFHVYLTPPSPAREIDFKLEYDTSYLEGLFG